MSHEISNLHKFCYVRWARMQGHPGYKRYTKELLEHNLINEKEASRDEESESVEIEYQRKQQTRAEEKSISDSVQANGEEALISLRANKGDPYRFTVHLVNLIKRVGRKN